MIISLGCLLLIFIITHPPNSWAFLDEKINEELLGIDYQLNFELNEAVRDALTRYLEEVPLTNRSHIIVHQIISTFGRIDESGQQEIQTGADLLEAVHVIGDALVIRDKYCDCSPCPPTDGACTRCPIPCNTECPKCPLPESCPLSIESNETSCPTQPLCSSCPNSRMNGEAFLREYSEQNHYLKNLITNRYPSKIEKEQVENHEIGALSTEYKLHPAARNATTEFSEVPNLDEDFALFDKNVHTVIPDTAMREYIIALVESLPPLIGGNQELMAFYLLEQFRGKIKKDDELDKFTRNTARSNFKRVLGHFLERWRRRNCKCSECGTFQRCEICQLEESCANIFENCAPCEPLKYCPTPTNCPKITPCPECYQATQ